MEPIFTDKQLNNMSREDLISLMKIVQEQTKKKDTEIQLLKEKQKELEFLNAMLSDRLTLAQRKQFGASSEKYAEGYEQMNLFNEAEASADAETEELWLYAIGKLEIIEFDEEVEEIYERFGIGLDADHR